MTALPDYADALARAIGNLSSNPVTESVPLDQAPGRVLAETIVADRDLPPFDRAQMDGYALRAAEVQPGRSWPVAADVPAGASGDIAVPPGASVSIATGAVVPPDLDTVIQHELSDRGDPVRFTVDTIAPGHAVHHRGSDAREGEALLPPGLPIEARHVGVAASVGRDTLLVRRRPAVRLLTSGDEIVEPGEAVQTHQVRNSNRPMLAALLPSMGAIVAGAEHLPDDRDTTVAAVGRALDEADVLVTVGGVSAGARDHFPAAFEAQGVACSLRHAAIQPGKPIFIGRRGDAVIVGLPGNPVSVLACACLFLWPIIRVLGGRDGELPWRPVTLARAVRPNSRRRAFRPAMLDSDGRVTVPKWAGSGDLAHTVPTAGLVELPVQEEAVEAGVILRFLAWPG